MNYCLFNNILKEFLLKYCFDFMKIELYMLLVGE